MKSCENFERSSRNSSRHFQLQIRQIYVCTTPSTLRSVRTTYFAQGNSQLYGPREFWVKAQLARLGVVDAYLEVFATLKSHIYTKFKQHQLLLGRGQWREISVELAQSSSRPIFGLHVSLVAQLRRRSSTTTVIR